jgi:O-antigen ligase
MVDLRQHLAALRARCLGSGIPIVLAAMFTIRSLLAISSRIVFLTYSVFFAGSFFLFFHRSEHYEFYSWALLPFAAILTPTAFKLLKSSRLFWLVFAYAAYMLLAAAWSQPFQIDEFLLHSQRILYVLSFIVVTVVLLHEYPEQFEMLLKITCVCAAIAAVAGIALWYSEHAFPESRLLRIGKFDNPILAACVFGFFGILALRYALHEKAPALRLGFIVCVMVILALVIFSQSRTSIIAFIVVTLMVTLFHHRKTALFLILTFVAAAVVIWVLSPDLAAKLTRSVPARPDIWASAFSHAMDAPLFGHGSLSDRSIVSPLGTFAHAHNPFLGSFRDGGIIGLALLFALLGYAGVAALRYSRSMHDPKYLALWGYLILCIMPTDDRLLVLPTEESWVYFWLPLIFLIWKLLRTDV